MKKILNNSRISTKLSFQRNIAPKAFKTQLVATEEVRDYIGRRE